MAGRLSRLLGGRRPGPRRWGDLAAHADALPRPERAALAEEARRLRADLDRFLLAARRQPDAVRPDLPPGTDWWWRPLPFLSPLDPRGLVSPAPGSGLAPGISVWHDLADAPLILAQHPARNGADLPPFALGIESFARAGHGYVGISFDLPEEALAGLDTTYILRAATVMAAEAPATAYLRLNVEHGPDTEQVVRNLDTPGPGGGVRAETGFDLGFVPMNPRRLAKIWLDVIVEKPGANAVRLHDLVISRHHRADV